MVVPASVYDLKYAFIDQDRHLADVEALIARHRPGARSLLDVACGTGVQADRLAGRFVVVGLDVDPEEEAILAGRQVRLEDAFIISEAPGVGPRLGEPQFGEMVIEIGDVFGEIQYFAAGGR